MSHQNPAMHQACDPTCECNDGLVCDNMVFTILMPMLYKEHLREQHRGGQTTRGKGGKVQAAKQLANRLVQRSSRELEERRSVSAFNRLSEEAFRSVMTPPGRRQTQKQAAGNRRAQ